MICQPEEKDEMQFNHKPTKMLLTKKEGGLAKPHI